MDLLLKSAFPDFFTSAGQFFIPLPFMGDDMRLLFDHGWLLFLLLFLPLVWFLLQVTPPAPRHILFPALRLIRGLGNKNQSADKAPWWSILIRLSFIACLIIGLARPSLYQEQDFQSNKPFFILVDNSWASARNWSQIQKEARTLISFAQQQGVRVYFSATHGPFWKNPTQARTADGASAVGPFGPFDPSQAADLLNKLTPYPIQDTPTPAFIALLKQEQQAERLPDRSFWLGTGLKSANFAQIQKILRQSGPIQIFRPQHHDLPVTLRLVRNTPAQNDIQGPNGTEEKDENTVSLLLQRATFTGENPDIQEKLIHAPQFENGFLARELYVNIYGRPLASSAQPQEGFISSPLPRLTQGNQNASIDVATKLLYQQKVTLPAYATQVSQPLEMPAALLSQATHLKIQGENHAGATYILDDRWNRHHMGILQQDHMQARPYLSGIWYLDRAAGHLGSVSQAPLSLLLRQNITTLLIPGMAQLSPQDQEELIAWVKAGGILIQFAGQSLTNIDMANPQQTALFPVNLRSGGRVLDGKLQWDSPLKLADFPANSPFAGLEISEETRQHVTIYRHFMAQPGPESRLKSWARLSDGTSLVSGDKLGAGWRVFFHAGMDANWSNLATSPLFPNMLDRLSYLEKGTIAPAKKTHTGTHTGAHTSTHISQNWYLKTALLANGTLHHAPKNPPIIEKALDLVDHLSFDQMPGLYGQTAQSPVSQGAYIADRQNRALNLSDYIAKPQGEIAPFVIAETRNLDQFYDQKRQPAFSLVPYLLFIAVMLYLLDYIITLYLRGQLPNMRFLKHSVPRYRKQRPQKFFFIFGLFLGGALLVAGEASTSWAQQTYDTDALEETEIIPFQQDQFGRNQGSSGGNQQPERRNSLNNNGDFSQTLSTATQIGYITTGDSRLDQISADGLLGLSEILNRRTAIQAAPPVALNPAQDELSFFALIYWPISSQQAPLSQTAKERLNNYLSFGGTILFDLRNPNQRNQQSHYLQRLTEGLNIPSVVQITPEHVLGQSFYLLHDFPGRWQGGELWLEPEDKGTADGVSRVIIGAADWASAWALDEYGRPRFPVSPGGERQREHAFRFGVNLMMYMLTGNYKKDQVHMPAILKRLGQ